MGEKKSPAAKLKLDRKLKPEAWREQIASVRGLERAGRRRKQASQVEPGAPPSARYRKVRGS